MTRVLETRLRQIIQTTPWLMHALESVSDEQIPEAYIAAGAIRNRVWNFLVRHSGSLPGSAEDVDVVYFDPQCSTTDWRARLVARVPILPWEVVNQASIHEWQPRRVSQSLESYSSVKHALESWPDTATAVAVRLTRSDELDVLAPFGLEDLFAGILRPNPQCPDPGAFARRVAEKGWLRRWPNLLVVDR